VRYTSTVMLTEGLSFRRTRTAQQLADGLSERILSGSIAPGQRLRESALAEALGVARNTVREAMRILEIGGLVRHEVNRGAVVISPTPETLEELYESRVVLESTALLSTTKPEQIEEVEKAYARLLDVASSRDARQIVSADLALHGAIVGMLNNSRIESFYKQLSRSSISISCTWSSTTGSSSDTPRSSGTTAASWKPFGPGTSSVRPRRQRATSDTTRLA